MKKQSRKNGNLSDNKHNFLPGKHELIWKFEEICRKEIGLSKTMVFGFGRGKWAPF